MRLSVRVLPLRLLLEEVSNMADGGCPCCGCPCGDCGGSGSKK